MVTLTVPPNRRHTSTSGGRFTTCPIDAPARVAEDGRMRRSVHGPYPAARHTGVARRRIRAQPRPAGAGRRLYPASAATALAVGKTASMTWLVAVHSGYAAKDPRACRAGRLESARARSGPRLLLDGHLSRLGAPVAGRYRGGGRPEVQRFVRAGLFALLCSMRADVPASIAPMGLSSLGYNGHIFWDADTWMYPAAAAPPPRPGARHGRLPPAIGSPPPANARAAEGYQGAMFPWESATDGDGDDPLLRPHRPEGAPYHRLRGARPVAVLPGHRRSGVAGRTMPGRCWRPPPRSGSAGSPATRRAATRSWM